MKIYSLSANKTDFQNKNFAASDLQGTVLPAVFSEFQNIKTFNSENLKANYINKKRFKNVQNFEIPYCGKGSFLELNNGHKIAIIQKNGAFSIATAVSTDPKEKLKAHLLEHLIYNSKNLVNGEQFGVKLDSAGAKRDAQTNQSNTVYSIQYPFDDSNKIKDFVHTQGALLKIKDEDIKAFTEKEKQVLINEYAISDSKIDKFSSASLSDIQALSKVVSLMFETNADPLDLKPTLEKTEAQDLQNITSEQIIEFYKKNYNPKNMFTVIFTPTNVKDLEKTVIDAFNSDSWQTNQSKPKLLQPKINQPVRADLITDGENKISVSFLADGNQNIKENMIVKLLEYYLRDSGCIFDNLDMSAYNADKRIISFYAPFEKDKEESDLQGLYSKLSQLKNTEIESGKLELYKSKIKNDFSFNTEFSSILIQTLINSDFKNNPQIFEQQLDALEKINEQDLQNYLKKYIDFQKACVIVNHKSEEKPKIPSFKASAEKINTKDVKEYSFRNNLRLITDTPENIKRSVYRVNLSSEMLGANNIAICEAFGLVIKDNLKKNFENEAVSDYSVKTSKKGLDIFASSLPLDSEKLIKVINSSIQEAFEGYKDFEKFQAKAVLVIPKTNFEQNKDKFLNLIQNGYNSFAPKSNRITILLRQPKDETVFKKTDSENSVFSIRYKLNGCDNLKQDIATSLLNNILGNMLTSKLETELRNNQNLYSTGSSYKTDGASGVFSLGTQFKINKDENQVKKLFESINKILSDLSEKPVENDILTNAKNVLKGDLALLSESSLGRAEILSTLELNQIKDYFKTIDEITVDDIKNTAQNIFSLHKTYYLESKPEILERNKEIFTNIS